MKTSGATGASRSAVSTASPVRWLKPAPRHRRSALGPVATATPSLRCCLRSDCPCQRDVDKTEPCGPTNAFICDRSKEKKTIVQCCKPATVGARSLFPFAFRGPLQRMLINFLQRAPSAAQVRTTEWNLLHRRGRWPHAGDEQYTTASHRPRTPTRRWGRHLCPD